MPGAAGTDEESVDEAAMFAKYHMNVHDTSITEGDDASVSIGGPRNIVVRVSTSSDHDRTLVLEALATFEPDAAVLRVFNDLANDRLPSDAESYETLSLRVEPGESLGGHLPSPLVLPEPFRSFSEMISRELFTAARTTADLYRWRTNSYPTHPRRVSSGGTHFSFDGEDWFRLPFVGSVRLSVVAAVRLDDGRFTAAVQPLLDRDLEEPVGFGLLAEAAELLESNPRAALIMAIAALEVGLKSFIGTLVPLAEWLAMRAPGPPLVRMLGEYLPQLPVQRPLPSGKVLPPPPSAIRVIKEGIDKRNAIAHTGSKTPYELVERVLDAVADVLRLLDYYLGNEWAAEQMSCEFAVDLGLR